PGHHHGAYRPGVRERVPSDDVAHVDGGDAEAIRDPVLVVAPPRRQVRHGRTGLDDEHGPHAPLIADPARAGAWPAREGTLAPRTRTVTTLGRRVPARRRHMPEPPGPR